jgi:neurofibromin 1
LQRELDHAALKAAVPLTEGLVLKVQGEEGEETQTVVKSRLFYRQYLHSVKVLERAHHLDNASFNQSPSFTNVNGAATRTPVEDSTTLAILALSNLLSANIDVGLKHCLTLGYHEDPNLRTAFMQLLTNILQQGTRFNGLTAKHISSSPKPYLDLLTSQDLALALAICEGCPPAEVDEVSMLLFRVFEEKGNLLPLVKVLIEREVAQTSELMSLRWFAFTDSADHESELFRANSITTRILTIFAKTYG